MAPLAPFIVVAIAAAIASHPTPKPTSAVVNTPVVQSVAVKPVQSVHPAEHLTDTSALMYSSVVKQDYSHMYLSKNVEAYVDTAGSSNPIDVWFPVVVKGEKEVQAHLHADSSIPGAMMVGTFKLDDKTYNSTVKVVLDCDDAGCLTRIDARAFGLGQGDTEITIYGRNSKSPK